MSKILIVSFQSLNGKDVAGPGKLGYYLATHFYKQGHLNNLIVSSKGTFTTTFPSLPVSFWSRYYLFLLNKFWKYNLITYYRKRFLEEELYDFFLQFRIKTGCKTLISINPYLYRTLRKCKRLGVKTILIPANPEENEINSLLDIARKKWDVGENQTDVYTYKPRVEKYNASVPLFDFVIAHTSIIENTFRKRRPNQTIVPCHGLIWTSLQGNAAKSNPSENTFKVFYLAHTILLKGLQELLQAWSVIDTTHAELHIGGQIDPVVKRIIDQKFQHLNNNVVYHGAISDVNLFLKDASLFVCPSIIDAVPITVLEAAAKGIPSIVTDMCGVKDVLEANRTGFIVPASESGPLASQLMKCMSDKSGTSRIGHEASLSLKAISFDNFVVKLANVIDSL